MVSRQVLKQLQRQGMRLRINSVGASMEPILPHSSILEVECCSSGDIHSGDVVVFRLNEHIVCHRCIKVTEKYLLEKGDNCALWFELRKVPKDSVIGKVVKVCLPNGENVPLSTFRTYNTLAVQIARISNFVGCMLRRGSKDAPDAAISRLRFPDKAIALLMERIYLGEINGI